MARSIEGIVEAHRAAAERRASGRPIWDRTINFAEVFHNEEMSFEERRDVIVRILNASKWSAINEEIDNLIYEIANSQDVDEFDQYWDWLYDEADTDRVWIKTV
jgi:hypothetical protein